jgi:hypothetical protein
LRSLISSLKAYRCLISVTRTLKFMRKSNQFNTLHEFFHIQYFCIFTIVYFLCNCTVNEKSKTNVKYSPNSTNYEVMCVLCKPAIVRFCVLINHTNKGLRLQWYRFVYGLSQLHPTHQPHTIRTPFAHQLHTIRRQNAHQLHTTRTPVAHHSRYTAHHSHTSCTPLAHQLHTTCTPLTYTNLVYVRINHCQTVVCIAQTMHKPS